MYVDSVAAFNISFELLIAVTVKEYWYT